MKVFAPNTKGYRVLTPTGYCNFAGVALMGESPIVKLVLSDNTTLECTEDHKVFQPNMLVATVSELQVGNSLITQNGIKYICDIQYTDRVEPVYDLIEVENGHVYYTNGILSSNCEFISFDDLLIDSAVLNQIIPKEPIVVKQGVKWFSQPRANHTYVIALDPAMGNNGDRADYAAIQVFELPTMQQVAEWVDKSTPADGQVQMLRQIIMQIHQSLRRNPDQHDEPQIYWSIENNNLGEACLLAVNVIGEENFPGWFVHEPKKTSGGVKRKGLTTTHPNKITACSRFKSFLETRRMKLYSSDLISQLKTFVGVGGTYKAKVGEKDDLVMATILCVRLIQIVSNWDSELENIVNQIHMESGLADMMNGDDDSDSVDPMPFVFI
jgi:hypothetical protein